MKSPFLIPLLSFVTFSSAANAPNPNALIPRAFSAKQSFFENNSLMQYLFEVTDFDPSFRLISKDFKEAHDLYCSYYLALIDSRLKHYLNDIRTNVTGGHFVPSLVSPTLRMEVPLYYLFSKYLKAYASTIPQTAAQNQDTTEVQEQQDALTLRRADIDEGRRFIKDVMRAFTGRVFGTLGQTLIGSDYLLYLYILTKSCFLPNEFNLLGFPINSLLLHAVRGEFPAPYGEEIVRDFNTNSIPKLAHEALKAGQTNLACIILNKPGAANTLATYIDNYSRTTTLHYCAMHGAVDLINKCLEMGANPLLTDLTQIRPIHCAVKNGHLEATRRLFELDQEVVYPSSSALSPLLIACYNGKTEIVELFLSHPNITLIGNQLFSEDMANFVLDWGNTRMAQVLLDSGKLELSDEIYNLLFSLSSSL